MWVYSFPAAVKVITSSEQWTMGDEYIDVDWELDLLWGPYIFPEIAGPPNAIH